MFLRFTALITSIVFIWNTVAFGQISAPEPRPFQPLQIIHIQDAHANYTAQKNICELIERFQKEQGIDLVFVEGAAGPLDRKYLQFSPDPSINKKVTDKLAQMGELSGADLYLLKEHAAPVQFVGLEDPKLYAKNLESFRAVFAREKETTAKLRAERARLDLEASRLNNKNLLTLLRHYLNFELEKNQIQKTVLFLDQISRKSLNRNFRDAKEQKDFPNLVRLLRLMDDENKINLEAAKNEAKQIERVLSSRRRPGSSVFNVILDSGLRRNDKMTNPRFLLEQLYADIASQGFSFEKYPNFSTLAKNRVYQYELKSQGLFEELLKLMSILFDSLSVAESEKNLIRRAKEYVTQYRLASLELTREEWEESPSLEGDFNQAISFYQAALDREKHFMSVIHETMQKKKKQRAIVVAGGFHTDGLKSEFARRGIDCQVVAPEVKESSREIYVNSILGNYRANLDRSQFPAADWGNGWNTQSEMNVPVTARQALLKKIMDEVTSKQPVSSAASLGGMFGVNEDVNLLRLSELTGFTQEEIRTLRGFWNHPGYHEEKQTHAGEIELVLWAAQIQASMEAANSGLRSVQQGIFNHYASQLRTLGNDRLAFDMRIKLQETDEINKSMIKAGRTLLLSLNRFRKHQLHKAGSKYVRQNLHWDRLPGMLRAVKSIIAYQADSGTQKQILDRMRADGFISQKDAQIFIDEKAKAFAKFMALINKQRALVEWFRQSLGLTSQEDNARALKIERAKFIKQVQPYLDFLSYVPDMAGMPARPDIFLAVTNPDVRTFVKLAEKWVTLANEEREPKLPPVPIVVSGGNRENGKEMLIEHLQAYYGRDIRDEDIALFRKEGARESDIIKWILEKHGVDPNYIFLERESTNTPQSFLKSVFVIKPILGDRKKSPIYIQVVTCPPLNLRAHLTAQKQWEDFIREEGWKVITRPLYEPESYYRSDRELLDVLHYVLGFPKEFRPTDLRLNRKSEVDRIDQYSKETYPPDVAMLDIQNNPWTAEKVLQLRETVFLNYLQTVEKYQASASSLGVDVKKVNWQMLEEKTGISSRVLQSYFSGGQKTSKVGGGLLIENALYWMQVQEYVSRLKKDGLRHYDRIGEGFFFRVSGFKREWIPAKNDFEKSADRTQWLFDRFFSRLKTFWQQERSRASVKAISSLSNFDSVYSTVISLKRIAQHVTDAQARKALRESVEEEGFISKKSAEKFLKDHEWLFAKIRENTEKVRTDFDLLSDFKVKGSSLGESKTESKFFRVSIGDIRKQLIFTGSLMVFMVFIFSFPETFNEIFFQVRPLSPTFYFHEFLHGSWDLDNLNIPDWAKTMIQFPPIRAVLSLMVSVGHSINHFVVQKASDFMGIWGYSESGKYVSNILPNIVDMILGAASLRISEKFHAASLEEGRWQRFFKNSGYAFFFIAMGYFTFSIVYFVSDAMGFEKSLRGGDYSGFSNFFFGLDPGPARTFLCGAMVFSFGFFFVDGIRFLRQKISSPKNKSRFTTLTISASIFTVSFLTLAIPTLRFMQKNDRSGVGDRSDIKKASEKSAEGKSLGMDDPDQFVSRLQKNFKGGFKGKSILTLGFGLRVSLTEQLKELGSNVTEGDKNPHFRERLFDAIVADNSLTVTPTKRSGFLSELARVTKPNGVIVIYSEKIKPERRGISHGRILSSFYEKYDYAKLAEAAGFQVLEHDAKAGWTVLKKRAAAASLGGRTERLEKKKRRAERILKILQETKWLLSIQELRRQLSQDPEFQGSFPSVIAKCFESDVRLQVMARKAVQKNTPTIGLFYEREVSVALLIEKILESAKDLVTLVELRGMLIQYPGFEKISIVDFCTELYGAPFLKDLVKRKITGKDISKFSLLGKVLAGMLTLTDEGFSSVEELHTELMKHSEFKDTLRSDVWEEIQRNLKLKELMRAALEKSASKHLRSYETKIHTDQKPIQAGFPWPDTMHLKASYRREIVAEILRAVEEPISVIQLVKLLALRPEFNDANAPGYDDDTLRRDLSSDQLKELAKTKIKPERRRVFRYSNRGGSSLGLSQLGHNVKGWAPVNDLTERVLLPEDRGVLGEKEFDRLIGAGPVEVKSFKNSVTVVVTNDYFQRNRNILLETMQHDDQIFVLVKPHTDIKNLKLFEKRIVPVRESELKSKLADCENIFSLEFFTGDSISLEKKEMLRFKWDKDVLTDDMFNRDLLAKLRLIVTDPEKCKSLLGIKPKGGFWHLDESLVKFIDHIVASSLGSKALQRAA